MSIATRLVHKVVHTRELPMSTNYLYKRNNIYYFRLRIPKDLKHVIPATEIKKSLKSCTKHKAKSLAKVIGCEVEETFMLLRSHVLTHEQQIEVAGRLLRLGSRKAGWVNRAGKVVAIESNVEEGASKAKVRLLSEVIDEYVREKKCRWVNKTLVEYTSNFEIILRIIGDKDIKAYSRSDLLTLRETILLLPPSLTKKAAYQGKSIQQIIDIANGECISEKTANGYIINIVAVFKWALKQTYLDVNYADGLTLPENKTRPDLEREAYSIGDIKRLFLTEGYVGDTRHKEPEKFWIPLIALYSGLRLNEICQLKVDDIVEMDGVPCFDVNNRSDNQVKTNSSIRIVPVHPTLMKCGLLSYVEKVREKEAPRLWMNLRKYREGYSKHFGRWYSEMNRECITDNRRKCFHSFRHTVIDALKQLGIQDTLISEIVGHSTSDSMTMGRYGKRYRPKVLLEALSHLDYGIEPPVFK